MKTAVVVFPGSNSDRDLMVALEAATGRAPTAVWHKETTLPDGVDLVGLPGGFAFGDYLRCGAIAARSPIMPAVAAHAARGGYALGICNGWQVMIEAGLLPGALMRNAGLRFVSKRVLLRVERIDTRFTSGFEQSEVVSIPIAHHDGSFAADADTARRLHETGRVAFRYVDALGRPSPEANPNGSIDNIAGVFSENGRVLGLMPHPERAPDPEVAGGDGARFFAGLADRIAA